MIDAHILFVRKVAPPAGAWIETVDPALEHVAEWSRLPQARGLKHPISNGVVNKKWSRLPQARGLKPLPLL